MHPRDEVVGRVAEWCFTEAARARPVSLLALAGGDVRGTEFLVRADGRVTAPGMVVAGEAVTGGSRAL